jgi:hypothetical protein
MLDRNGAHKETTTCHFLKNSSVETYFAYDKFVLDPCRDVAMLESASRQNTEKEVSESVSVSAQLIGILTSLTFLINALARPAGTLTIRHQRYRHGPVQA